MALVNTKKMFDMAYKNGYAIGAFNVNNMEITQGIIDAVAEEKAPVILQISRGARAYAKNSYLKAIINVVVEENPDIPVAINLDHGDTFETCKQFVDDGFTSVMIDASSKPLEENIAITRQVVEYAHARDVVVEAELGQLGGIEEDVVGVSHDDLAQHLADPNQVEEFVAKSGVDSLAVAIGTSHGAYKFSAGNARFEQCAEGIRRSNQQIRRQYAERDGRSGRRREPGGKDGRLQGQY